MTERGFRIIAVMLLLSLVAGIGAWIFGTLGRVRPHEIDSIWRSVDEIRGQVIDKHLALREGAKIETSFLEYRLTVLRLGNEPPAVERYLLAYRPAYQFVFSTEWKPSAWDLAMIAFESSSGGRDAVVVVAKRVKE